MGTNYYAVMKKPTIADPIHIGKSSIGWKFLFHSIPGYFNYVSGESLDTYGKWVKFLKEYTENDTTVYCSNYGANVSNNPDDFVFDTNHSNKNLNDGTCFRVVGSTVYGTGGITNEESRKI